MSTSTVLDETAGLLKGRLAELEDERKRIERALSAINPPTTTGRRSGRGPGRPSAGSKKSASPKSKGGRTTRADDAVRLVGEKPGISAAEIAKQLKIKPNYLYRVLGGLEKEKRIKKNGRQYFPV